jgi:hypothetical protein
LAVLRALVTLLGPRPCPRQESHPAAQSHSLPVLCSPGMAAARMVPIRVAASRPLHAPQQRVMHPVVAAAGEPREVQRARERRARARCVHKRPRRDLLPLRWVCARHGVGLQERSSWPGASAPRPRMLASSGSHSAGPARDMAQRTAHGQAQARRHNTQVRQHARGTPVAPCMRAGPNTGRQLSGLGPNTGQRCWPERAHAVCARTQLHQSAADSQLRHDVCASPAARAARRLAGPHPAAAAR